MGNDERLPRMATTTAVCSFCLRPASEVRRLVAGPGVYIWDGCVERCDGLVRTTPDGIGRAPGVTARSASERVSGEE